MWRSGLPNCTARRARPVRRHRPTPTAPWCRFALPSEAAVERRIIAITGNPLKMNHPGIGYPFEGVAVEHIIEVDEAFDQRHVGLAAERIEPRQNVGDMALQILTVGGAAIGLVEKAIFLDAGSPGSLAARATGRLDAEARPIFYSSVMRPTSCWARNGTDQLRHGDPASSAICLVCSLSSTSG